MPLNCPECYPDYDACLACCNRNGKECWAFMPYCPPMKLSGILTIEERIAILEDRLADPNITGNIKGNEARFIKSKDYQKLERMVLLVEEIEEKLNNHIDKTAKPKSSYA